MARKPAKMSTTPMWPTTVRSRSKDGRIRGTDGSVWLYRAVPMAPVADARSPDEGLVAGEPLREVFSDLAAATSIRVPRRSMAKSGYRDIHIMLVNIPVRFTPPKGSQLAAHLSGAFQTEPVDRRLLLFGVKLRDRVGGTGGVSAAVDSVVQTITTGVAPMSDYDNDFASVDGIMARSGLVSPSAEDYRVANAWWNHGRSPDAPLLVHTDHIHVFGSSDSARAAAALVERDGDSSCGSWNIASHHTVSFGCVQDFDLPYVEESSRAAQWASGLIDVGAVCVSIRGKLEPPQVTRGELRRRKKQAIDDETERASQHKMSRSELDERLTELDEMEAVYAIGGPPALIDCSTVVAFSGMDEHSGYDMHELGTGHGVILSTMTARQNTAMAETWLASNVRANPYLHDIPSHTIAASGLPSLSTVGDRDGALLGFTERDRQPSYISPTAAADEDSLQILVCVGQSGSGKLHSLSTKVPTPSGWTSMGELGIGQQVFGSDGLQYTVKAIYEEQHPVLFDVHFGDGQMVRACKDHLWPVSNWQDRNSLQYTHRIQSICPHVEPRVRVLTTQEMINAGVRQGIRKQEEFAVRIPAPIQCDERILPIHPYSLGVWLGDGSSGEGQIPKGVSQSCTDKHIPTEYLRASEPQRLALLQGLMDTDGTISNSGACELALSDERLVMGCLELVRSLGIKASISSGPSAVTEDDPDRPGKKRRRQVGTRWRIHFTTTTAVFRLPRKLARIPIKVRATQQWNYITKITPAPSEPGRCITVDSPDHTYLVEGFIPTHNTAAMLYLADQFSRQINAIGQRRPVVIVDPKQQSTHSAVVLAAGGRVASLDELTAADGVFDPMRFTARKEVGVELATSVLMSINPWGTGRSDYEVPLIKALAYGADRGADCIGVALQMALDDGQAPPEMVARVFDLAGASPMFRACVGTQQGGPRLRSDEGITLIKVGDAYLDLPEPGAVAEATQQQRIALALVRMMVFGSAMALTGRQGVLMLDEAWVMLSAGRSEVERLGRLARSQQVLPMLFTQRVTDALDAGLSGYISRGIILPIQDPGEAQAAFELFRLEPTPERMSRITAKSTMGGVGGGEAQGAPNWSSMRALRDPVTGKVLRGSIGIYVDLSGRTVPVEIKLPDDFLRLASTNPEDIRRRMALSRQPAVGLDPDITFPNLG